MALNKSQTTLGVKVVLVIVAIAMVGFLFPSILSLFQGTGNSGTSSTQSAQQGTLDQIAAKYNAIVASNEASLSANPNDYQMLVNQANTYFDWGLEVKQAAQQNQTLVGSDQPMWLAARQFYERAIAAKGDDPNVQVDYAITFYYSGDTSSAVGIATKVTEDKPDFAPAWFNLGVFLAASNLKDRAIAAFEKSLDLDPQGTSTNVDYAKQQLAALKGESASTTTTP